VRTQQRRDAAGDVGQRRRLHGDHDDVLHAERGGIVAGGRRARDRAGEAVDAKAVFGQRRERRAARDCAHLMPAGGGQARADQQADGARAVDADFHGDIRA
jgi:hypothetical protein